MALRGTLKDFGIADILQLIAQQQKTGVLHLKNRDDEVHISFKDGLVVRAQSVSRKRKDLLGDMLVRAELISEKDLTFALEEQRRTLKRLGEVLVASAAITRERLREMAHLQTSEILYKLFTWNAGTYEFEGVDVEADPDSPSIRSESVLMEGFRRVDEWPMIRKRIPSSRMSFERVKDPPATVEAAHDDVDIDAAFGGAAVSAAGPATVGPNEKRVFELVLPGRTVDKIVDLSRCGEFEACKALFVLLNGGYLRAVPPRESDVQEEPIAGLVRASLFEKLIAGIGRVAVTVIILALAIPLLLGVKVGGLTLAEPGSQRFADPATQRFLSSTQMDRLRSALAVYQVEKGELPEKLASLVETGIVQEEDLHYPWSEGYYYQRRDAANYVLLPPLR
jgi:hypothetical protein